eukprot:496708-Prymnesium_polylepis.1
MPTQLAQCVAAIAACLLSTAAAQQDEPKGKCQAGRYMVYDWRQMLTMLPQPHRLKHSYQFGVFGGTSMATIRSFFPHDHLFGFDSFEGFPQESSQEKWKQLDFAAGTFKFNNMDVLRQKAGEPTTFIRGFYNVSLTKDLAASAAMKPARYIDIDCDLYVSTIDALTWMFKSGLVAVGTLIGYDDWWITPCSKKALPNLSPLDTAEGRAHKEIAETFGVRFSCAIG